MVDGRPDRAEQLRRRAARMTRLRVVATVLSDGSRCIEVWEKPAGGDWKWEHLRRRDVYQELASLDDRWALASALRQTVEQWMHDLEGDDGNAPLRIP